MNWTKFRIARPLAKKCCLTGKKRVSISQLPPILAFS
jgi:hypothetical protein